MRKKLAILPLFAIFLMPMQSAYALELDGTDALLDNLADAQSVDFSVDADFETKHDAMEEPLTVHADFDGVWSESQNGEFNLSFWVDDQFGEFSESNGSVVVTPDRLYFYDGEEWFYLDLEPTDTEMVEEGVDTSVQDTEEFMNELFERGVIEYELETLDFVNGVLAARYSYEMNATNLVNYLVDEGMIADEDANETYSYLNDHVSVSGNLWVDPVEMLPVMFTLNIENTTETSYTTFSLSVLFNDFNQDVVVSEPEDATDIYEYEDSYTEDLIMTTVEKTAYVVDTDGDGLTDEAELEWNTNPLSPDSDGDGYNDYTEVVHGYNPNGSGMLDSDADGLSDYAEMTIHWSDPYNPDTDGDGYLDGNEIFHGYDPNGPGRW